MVELKQRYRVNPAFAKVKDGLSTSMVGEVVYIHPQKRYAVLAFAGPIGVSRESFYLDQLTDRNRVLTKVRH